MRDAREEFVNLYDRLDSSNHLKKMFKDWFDDWFHEAGVYVEVQKYYLRGLVERELHVKHCSKVAERELCRLIAEKGIFKTESIHKPDTLFIKKSIYVLRGVPKEEWVCPKFPGEEKFKEVTEL